MTPGGKTPWYLKQYLVAEWHLKSSLTTNIINMYQNIYQNVHVNWGTVNVTQKI